MSGATVESILRQVASLPLGEQERQRSPLINGNGDQQEVRPIPPIILALRFCFTAGKRSVSMLRSH
jgi:hypothetical protein